LKSAVTPVDNDRLLINPEWVPREAFAGVDLVDVDPRENGAANILRAGPELIHPDGFPRTRERLERLGFAVRSLDISELAKAEAAVTCCSLVFAIQPNLSKR
jgi:dimethylargininase